MQTSVTGFRGRIITSRKDLWKDGPFKPLTEGLAKTGGRNHHGVITVRHRGGGHRKVSPAGGGTAVVASSIGRCAPLRQQASFGSPVPTLSMPNLRCPPHTCVTPPPPLALALCQVYRLIDFARPTGTKAAVVQRLEYDPNRSAHIALVKHKGVDSTAALREQYRWAQVSPRSALFAWQPGAGKCAGLAHAHVQVVPWREGR